MIRKIKMDRYIRAAFDELLNEDGLAVMAKGMGMQRLLIKFLQFYSISQQAAGTHQKNTVQTKSAPQQFPSGLFHSMSNYDSKVSFLR